MHSGVFESAVKKYRQKSKAETVEGGREELKIPARVPPSVVEESSVRAQQSLENLPAQVLEQTKVFHRHIQHLAQAESQGAITSDLKRMLDDIGRAQKLDERIKEEILQDEDARNVSAGLCFSLHSAQVTESAARRCLCLVSRVSHSTLTACIDS